MSRRSVAVLLTAALSAVPAVAGCAAGGGDDGARAEATVRTDREPIAKRFPRLGAFTDVHWLGGTVGDDRVPGPSLYFIEAVVTLTPDEVARIASAGDLVPVASPRPRPPLAPFVSDGGTWTTSAQLEEGFAPPQWSAEVEVRLDAGVVHVSAEGE